MTTTLEKLKPVARVVSEELTQVELLRAELLARLRGGRDEQTFAEFEDRKGRVCAMGLASRILLEQGAKLRKVPDWHSADTYQVGFAFGLSRARIDHVLTLNDQMLLPFPIIADVLEFWWQRERDKAAKRALKKR